jgi:predicted ribosomally synthesized peptide with nif11-like leader
MSVDSARKFIEASQVDLALRSEVIGLGQDMDALLKLARSKGYDFSVEDLQETMRRGGLTEGVTYEAGQELTEAELTAVAGGSSHTKTWTGCACGKKGCSWTGAPDPC